MSSNSPMKYSETDEQAVARKKQALANAEKIVFQMQNLISDLHGEIRRATIAKIPTLDDIRALGLTFDEIDRDDEETKPCD